MDWTRQILRRLTLAVPIFAIGAAAVLGKDSPVEAAYRDYRLAQSNYTANLNNTTSAWKFARACFDLAEFATNDQQRASIANEGIRVAKGAIALHPDDPAPHFYLALNLGQLARTKLWTALHLIKDMEKAFLASIQKDERFNRASAHRSLGMLYQQAPGWPASIGSRAKARKHLLKAVELFPDYPDNHLTLLEAYLEWGELEKVRSGLETYRKMVPAAKEKYAGAEWEGPWRDWNERVRTIEGKLR